MEPAGEHLQQLLSAVQPTVSPAMNTALTKEFTSEEVKAALENIGDLKAPRPDGMPAIFFKKYWDVVGEKLTREVLHILRGGPMPEGWNDTIISLIPKVDRPSVCATSFIRWCPKCFLIDSGKFCQKSSPQIKVPLFLEGWSQIIYSLLMNSLTIYSTNVKGSSALLLLN